MDNNAIYQKLDSIKNEIYEKIKISAYFFMKKENVKEYIKTIKKLKTRRLSLKKNEDKNQINAYKELILNYLNEILYIHTNIFNKEQFDTNELLELNNRFKNDVEVLEGMVKPSDTRKAVTTKKTTPKLSIKNEMFDFGPLDRYQQNVESDNYSWFDYPREQPKTKSNTVSCDTSSKKYKTIPFKIKDLKKDIQYNIDIIDNFKNKYKTQISNIIKNPKEEKIFWSEFSVIPRNFEEDNIKELVEKKNASNTLFDKINPFSVRNKTTRKIKKIKKQNKSVENSILQGYRDILQGIYHYLKYNKFKEWPKIDINEFYQVYSTLCNSEKLYKISEKNITNFKFNEYDLTNWHTYYNNLNSFNYNVLSKINLSIEGLCLLQKEFNQYRYKIMNYFDKTNNIEKQLQDLINKELFPQKGYTIISDIFTLCHLNKSIIEDWKKLKFDIINKINNNPINSTTKQLHSDDKEQLQILEEEINSIYNRDDSQEISLNLQRHKKELEELLLRKKFVILQEYATVDKWDSKTAIGGRKRKTRRKRKRRRKTRRKGKKRRKKRKTRRRR